MPETVCNQCGAWRANGRPSGPCSDCGGGTQIQKSDANVKRHVGPPAADKIKKGDDGHFFEG